MANETNIISKLTKGLKLKINKKKKSNWKSLRSNESLPPTPTEELMLYSSTEDEIYQAKINVEANRSFSYHTSHFNNNETNNTNNILSGLNSSNYQTNSSNIPIGRSRTTYNQPNNSSFSYQNDNILKSNNFNIYQQQTTQQNNYLYPTSNNSSRKNSYQTICVTSPSSTQATPIPINYTSSSTNSTAYPSAPNSPLSLDSSDTYVNDNNPFKMNLTINPKSTTKQVNNHLTITTSNMDPALSHSLISPIEFDGSGNEIKPSITTTTKNIDKQHEIKSTKQNNNKDPIPRSKSAKRIKPLITFDTPPVVTPMTAPDSDFEDNLRGRKRGGKKSKKHVKKRSSKLLSLKTSDVKDSSLPTMNKKPSFDNNKHLFSNNEEDDDVPLGIIQYKCLSSLLQESAPSNISSLQSNTKSFKSHSKNNYAYISPSAVDTSFGSSEKYVFPKLNNYYHENYVI